MGIIAGCRTAENRVKAICKRFGKDTYLAACEAMLQRTYNAMAQLIVQNIPEEPQSFEDWIDDDGLGHGPFKMKLTIWREGEHAYFDWSGTDHQAMGPVNFYLNEEMFKMFIGVYLIMVFDPQILFNDGFYPLLHVVIPDGSLLHPKFPSALGCRTHALTRLFDVLGGTLARKAPEYTTAAGYGTSPYMLYSGWDGAGDFFYLMEISYGGIPGRPIGDGMDGHSWWPLFENIPTEYLESYYPIRVDGYTTVKDSGGAGLHRGGNGIEKRYVYLEPGEVSIHDDRWLTYPWGILGGTPGPAPRRSSNGPTAPKSDSRRSATRSWSSRATCWSTGPPAAAGGKTRSIAPPSSSRPMWPRVSSPPKRRRTSTASLSAMPRPPRRCGRRCAPNEPWSRTSTWGHLSRRSWPSARKRPVSRRPYCRNRCRGPRWSPPRMLCGASANRTNADARHIN